MFPKNLIGKVSIFIILIFKKTQSLKTRCKLSKKIKKLNLLIKNLKRFRSQNGFFVAIKYVSATRARFT